MKLTPALALLALAAPSLAQTAAKPPVRPAATATHRATTGACADMPALGAAIPKIAGCPKTLFALRYIDTVIGTGPLAQPLKLYTVHYTGWLPDGTKFDSSVDRKDPIVFPAGVHRVITGWDTGFEGMHVGGKRRLFIPFELAYGDQGKPPTIPAKSMLVFDVELIAQADFPVQPTPQPAPRPATPPATTPATPPATPPTATPPPASAKPAPDGAKPPTVPGADPTKPTTVTPPATTTPPPTTSKP